MSKPKRDRTIAPGPASSSRSAPAVYLRRAATRIGRSAFAASAALAISAAPSAAAIAVVIHRIVSVISPIPSPRRRGSVSARSTAVVFVVPLIHQRPPRVRIASRS